MTPLQRLRRKRIARDGGESVENFLKSVRIREESLRFNRALPDGITVRQVESLVDVPQGRADFSLGAGSHTVVTTIAIDRVKARRGE